MKKYFDDVTFVGDEGIEVSKEIKQAIISDYTSGGLSQIPSSRLDSAKAHTPKPKPKPKPPKAEPSKNQNSDSETPPSDDSSEPARSRKPLWGF